MWEDIFGKPDSKKKDKKGRKSWWSHDDDDKKDWNWDWNNDDWNKNKNDWNNNGNDWNNNDWNLSDVLGDKAEQVKPYLYLARELVLDMAEAHSMPQMIFWMKASRKLHQLHHELCVEMPAEGFENDEDELQFKNEKPLVAAACGEKTKMFLNYAAFALMLPAYNEHKKFRTLMWLLQVEDREERANAQANTVADFHLNINI